MQKRVCRVSVLLVMIVAAVAIGGCMSRGTKISPERLTLVEKGRTTKEQVREMFGEPDSMMSGYGNTESWTYSYSTTNPLLLLPAVELIPGVPVGSVSAVSFTFTNGVVTNVGSLHQKY